MREGQGGFLATLYDLRSTRSKMMVTFTFDGKTYQLTANQANKAYDDESLIRLPDGTLLRAGGWFESCPPQPGDLTKVSVVSATSKTE
jgi:hypothetical protein